MAFATDFNDQDLGPALKQAYEVDKDDQLQQILESYLSHNDYLKLKNEMTDFALSKKGEPDGPFVSLNQAIDTFVKEGQLQASDGDLLYQL